MRSAILIRESRAAKFVSPSKTAPKKGGGLGVYFMKAMMDGVEYNTAHRRGNELILTKNKKGPP